MKRSLWTLLFVIFSAVTISSCQQDVTPPLIDVVTFFENPEIAAAKLSPDGKFISCLKPLNGVMNIWIKGIDEPFENSRPLTQETKRPIAQYFWTRDSNYILFLQDKNGDENFHLYRINPHINFPSPEDLTPFENVQVRLYSLPKNDPKIIYVGINDRDPRYHDVWKLNLDTLEKELVQLNLEKCSDWYFDESGTLRLSKRVKEDGSTELWTKDSLLYTASPEDIVDPIRFHKECTHLYISSNKGVDKSQLILLNTLSKEEELIAEDPEQEVDLGNALFSESSGELIATSFTGEKERLYFVNKEWEKDYDLLKQTFPENEIHITSTTADDAVMIIAATSDIVPGDVYLFNRGTKALTFLYRARPKIPTNALSSMKPVTYKARDGLTIHGYLTLPKGKETKNLPVIIHPHGGPWVRDEWRYDPRVQFLANRGYAVLQMNYRGSLGYGKQFLNAGNKEWGGAMQDDITDGVYFLINSGVADPKRIAIYGASYGGYAALAGVAFTPDLYQAGVSYVGPSNLITMLQSIPPYWETEQGFEKYHIGDLSNPEDYALLHERSPLFSASKIKAPLLVVQGAHDPRVKKAESDQIVMALHAEQQDVKYLVADNEGHGFRHPENNLAFHVALERFLAKHLKGRFQEKVSPEIEKRLEEITIDPGTVELQE